jgi:1-acyl-sn-glycerol-3-phosphate acyltransferase
MFKQTIGVILYIFWVFIYAYFILLPILIVNGNDTTKDKMVLNFAIMIKKLNQSVHGMLLKYVYDTTLYINEMDNIKNTINTNYDKIDILICNHIHVLDTIIILPLLNHYNVNQYTILFKKDLLYQPAFGLIMYMKPNINIHRSWDQDKSIITDQIDEIKTGDTKQILLLYPEGTRKTHGKFLEGQEFSKVNNLPVYDNLMVPRTKGLHLIIEHLKKTKRLGNLWDLSIVSTITDKFEPFVDTIDNVFLNIRKIDIPNNTTDPNVFKLWFMNEWKKKDIIMNNYKLLEYKKLKIKENWTILPIYLICLLILSKKSGRYYLIISIILGYFFILTKLR